MEYQWDFTVVWRNSHLLLWGLLGTLKVTGAALVLGLPLGLGVALMRLSRARAGVSRTLARRDLEERLDFTEQLLAERRQTESNASSMSGSE